MVRSGIYDSLSERIYPWFSKIYPVRAPLIYPLIAGFLFGFPLGSKICADLYDTGKITAKEAEVISCISNNFGPAFLYNYMVLSLNGGFLSGWMLLLICYLPPLLLGRFVLFSVQHQLSEKRPQKMPASRSAISLKIIDDGIMNGFSTMIKLAGYIMLFAIAAFSKTVSNKKRPDTLPLYRTIGNYQRNPSDFRGCIALSCQISDRYFYRFLWWYQWSVSDCFHAATTFILPAALCMF